MYRTVILWLVPVWIFAVPFTVATYNVENLFDMVYNGTEYPEYIPGKHGWTKRMAEKKRNHTAQVICDLNADIIGLQEIENETAFRALQRRLKRVGCPYPYGAVTHKKGAAIQVALLSRFPILHTRELQVSRSPRVRNILEVQVRIRRLLLTLFVNHWKSKSRKGYESKRIAYARVLQARIAGMNREREYMILGDLNSNYDAHLTLPVRLDDTRGRRGLTHILHTVEGRRLLTEADMVKGRRGIHYDLWEELPYPMRWSHNFYGHKSTLDHILLPSSLFDGKGIDYVNGTFRVFKRGYLFTKKGTPNHWQIKGGKHRGRGYSDHLPIVAQFDTVPYRIGSDTPLKKRLPGTIESLYRTEKLSHPLLLKNMVVVLKRGRYAVIKGSAGGRGIFVYGSGELLKEGRRYDLLVKEINRYHGLKEITAFSVLQERGTETLAPFYASLGCSRQNEVLHNLQGVYRNGFFYTEGKKMAIYFKKRHITPPNGSKLKITYAHLGYYKKLQLVVYSRKDFKILEK
jgi:endonuclease/exonuclease/phosphatase family metal-dependent hydrolase